MNKEKDLLTKMLNEKKISEDDYKLLIAAYDKKPSKLGQVFSLLTNPFQKIAGYKALILGIIIIVIGSYLAVIAKCYTVGVISCLNATVVKTTVQPYFLLLLSQNFIAWAVLTALYILAAKIFQQKGLRLIDFLGTVALARYPYLILIGILAIVRVINPAILNIDISRGLDLHPSFFLSLLGGVVILCFVWELVTYFYSLKESSGLLGKKLWISFIIALILGEVISSALIMSFLK